MSGPERWQNKKRDEIEADAIELARQAYAAKEVEIGEPVLRNAEKQIMLWAVDSRWVRHLTDLDRLREGIGLRALAQQDPVVAYKREAFEMYSEMIEAIRSDTVRAAFSVQLQRQQTQQARRPRPRRSPRTSAPIAATAVANPRLRPCARAGRRLAATIPAGVAVARSTRTVT